MNYKSHYVAFIDILGFSEMINSTIENDIENINKIEEHIAHVIKIVKDEYDKLFKIKIFSDCICMSCEEDISNFFFFIEELAYLQLFFSSSGIFIRGGLSVGHHYESDNIIYSKGLLSAYALEKEAMYPRVMIDKNLLKLVIIQVSRSHDNTRSF